VDKLPPYRLVITEHPGYLQATVTGSHNAANALRFLTETFAAITKSGHTSLLLDYRLTGPSLDSSSIFDVVAKRTVEGSKLRRIAYVDHSGHGRDPEKMKFAETVALNRGVNVRLFHELEDARRWLSEPTTRGSK
jgi:hypothetical protein